MDVREYDRRGGSSSSNNEPNIVSDTKSTVTYRDRQSGPDPAGTGTGTGPGPKVFFYRDRDEIFFLTGTGTKNDWSRSCLVTYPEIWRCEQISRRRSGCIPLEMYHLL
jgi:hypothetical protein